MEIGGFDIVLTGRTMPHGAIRDFLSILRQRWPEFQASYCDREGLNSLLETFSGEIPESTPDEGSIFIVRDERMKVHQGITGGTPMEDGDGPLTLYYGKMEGGWQITLVTPDDPATSPFSSWAYSEISKLLPNYALNTVV